MTKFKLIFVLFFIGLIYFLSLVFSGRLVLPQTFSVGPISIRYYGLLIAFAVASGFYLAKKRAPKYSLDEKTADNLLFWIIVGGFIGARLWHVATAWGYYANHGSEILQVWHGGLAIYGGVFGGIITLLLFAKRYTLEAKSLLDWLSPSLLLGQTIGRFGNFFNYELFGVPTAAPWKMFVPMQFRPEQYAEYSFFHPLFLYESLGTLIIFTFILKISPRKLKPGTLFFSYILLYNILRFFLEFLRIDSSLIGQFRLNAVVSLALVALSLACLLTQFRPYAKVS